MKPWLICILPGLALGAPFAVRDLTREITRASA